MLDLERLSIEHESEDTEAFGAEARLLDFDGSHTAYGRSRLARRRLTEIAVSWVWLGE